MLELLKFLSQTNKLNHSEVEVVFYICFKNNLISDDDINQMKNEVINHKLGFDEENSLFN